MRSISLPSAHPRSFAYDMIGDREGSNIRNARWRTAANINLILELA
jgi:hypothetical protein